MAAPILGERQAVRQSPVRDIQGLYLCYALNHPIVICVFWVLRLLKCFFWCSCKITMIYFLAARKSVMHAVFDEESVSGAGSRRRRLLSRNLSSFPGSTLAHAPGNPCPRSSFLPPPPPRAPPSLAPGCDLNRPGSGRRAWQACGCGEQRGHWLWVRYGGGHCDPLYFTFFFQVRCS